MTAGQDHTRPGPLPQANARYTVPANRVLAALPAEQKRQSRAEIGNSPQSASIKRDLSQVRLRLDELHRPRPHDGACGLGRAAQPRARHPDAGDLPEPGEVVERLWLWPSGVVRPPGERKEEPPRLVQGGVLGHVDRQRRWQEGRAVLPCGERNSCGGASRPQAEAERRGPGRLARPAPPEARGAGGLALEFRLVVGPKGFEVGVVEEEATAGGALAWVRVRLAFRQAEVKEPTGLRAFRARPHEQMVQLEHHSLRAWPCNQRYSSASAY